MSATAYREFDAATEALDTNADLAEWMCRFSRKHPGVHTVHCIFGHFFVATYPCPSRIHRDDVGQSKGEIAGYWKGGKQYPFSDKLVIRYHNSGFTCDR